MRKNILLFSSAIVASMVSVASVNAAVKPANEFRDLANGKGIHSTQGMVQEDILEQEKMSKSVGIRAKQDKEEGQQQISRNNAPEFTPAITRDEDGKVRIAAHISAKYDFLKDLNDLSYAIVKGEKRSIEIMNDLQKEGYIIKSFGGLEGTRSTYGDLSGLVLIAPDGDVYVAIHGTATVDDGIEIEGKNQGLMAGWETNFDGELVLAKPEFMNKGYCREMFNELLRYSKDLGGPSVLTETLEGMLYEDVVGYDQAKIMEATINAMIEKGQVSGELAKKLSNALFTQLRVMEYVNNNPRLFEGKVHNGFARKVYSYMPDLENVMTEIQQKMGFKGRVYITGHSMGGGLAVGTAEALMNLPSLNIKRGQLQAVGFSAARFGDEKFAKAFDEKVGNENYLRHNVADGDPVPIASGDTAMKALLEKVPALGRALGTFAGFADVGTLIYDDGASVWERAKEKYSGNPKYKDLVPMADVFASTIKYALSWVGVEVPETFAEAEKKFAWYDLWGRGKHAYQKAKFVWMVAKAARGNEDAIKDLSTVAAMRYGGLHFGHVDDNGDAVFNPAVVGTNIQEMAEKGDQHQSSRQDGATKQLLPSTESVQEAFENARTKQAAQAKKPLLDADFVNQAIDRAQQSVKQPNAGDIVTPEIIEPLEADNRILVDPVR
ncbi:MAG: lipase family protein [Alphaproteobacteria bacterium]